MSSNERKMMDSALKKVVIPVLRKQGFKGSFPHFRRMNEINIDLITFQFNRWGSSFVIELATCPLEGVTLYWGEQIPPNKVTAHDLAKRYRLGAKSEEDDGIWFSFENTKQKVVYCVLELLNTSDRLWIHSLLPS
jgi:Domain of unknown function (DUF4304)